MYRHVQQSRSTVILRIEKRTSLSGCPKLSIPTEYRKVVTIPRLHTATHATMNNRIGVRNTSLSPVKGHPSLALRDTETRAGKASTISIEGHHQGPSWKARARARSATVKAATAR